MPINFVDEVDPKNWLNNTLKELRAMLPEEVVEQNDSVPRNRDQGLHKVRTPWFTSSTSKSMDNHRRS